MVQSRNEGALPGLRQANYKQFSQTSHLAPHTTEAPRQEQNHQTRKLALAPAFVDRPAQTRREAPAATYAAMDLVRTLAESGIQNTDEQKQEGLLRDPLFQRIHPER